MHPVALSPAAARELLALALLFTQAVIAVPLIIRAARTRDADGASIAGEAIWVAGGLGWAVYGAGAGQPSVLASGVLAMLTSGTMAALLWRSAPEQHRTAVHLTALTVACLAIGFWAGGAAGLSIMLGMFSVVQFLPQLTRSVRYLRDGVPARGVSAPGAYMRALYTGGWAVYAGAWFLWDVGIDGVLWPLLIWGCVGVATFALQGLSARTRSLSARSVSGQLLRR